MKETMVRSQGSNRVLEATIDALCSILVGGIFAGMIATIIALCNLANPAIETMAVRDWLAIGLSSSVAMFAVLRLAAHKRSKKMK